MLLNSKEYHQLAFSDNSGLSSQVDVQVIVTEAQDGDVDKLEYQKHAYVAVGLIMSITIISVFFPMLLTSSAFGMNDKVFHMEAPVPCKDSCRFTMVESIPENLTYPAGSPHHMSTFEAWTTLLRLANHTVDIASFYWTLLGRDVYEDPSDWQGEKIFQGLLEAGRDRKIQIRIARNPPTPSDLNTSYETTYLAQHAGAQVRSLNMSRWFGGGILHTKLWVIDDTHFYVGSANMDWRSLTQVKEMGALVTDCPCLAKDVSKLFKVYWYMGQPNASIPSEWPEGFQTQINNATPIPVWFNDTQSNVYLSSSPPEFCPKGRTSDIDAILDVIDKAQKFVHIAVMDYFPVTLYTKTKHFWPRIDDALRRVAYEKNIEVRVLGSLWKHTRSDMRLFLKSLAALNGAGRTSIQVKLFEVPASEEQAKIPFARVNHNKYMVTDNTAYIGTSNWSADYFISTGGVGLVISQPGHNDTSGSSAQQQLEAVFERDWNSSYAHPIDYFLSGTQ